MSFSQYPYVNFSSLNMDWLLKTVKTYTEIVEQLNGWKKEHKQEYEELKKLYDDIVSGNFPYEMRNALEKWVRENAFNIIESLIKSVYFGLTDSGYFVAYIPENWGDIIFRTTGFDITIPLMPEYGHLVLIY